ncbi:MAG: cation:dicarboxylase symporter family transporter [Puniceicoccales bacterium]|jgi:Na+/H+-dicarboxylate symporter|nr:cation:dicarboxylase symporter family transporter [Puniceicoccales bacterium]
MQKKSSLFIFLLIVTAFAFGGMLPLSLQRGFLALSLSLKSVLLFFLPILIFSLLFCTFQRLGRSASGMLFSAIFFVCCSNFLATFLSHYVGEFVHSMNLEMIQPATGCELTPLFILQLPRLISTIYALVAGIGCGLVVPWLFPTLSQRMGVALDAVVVQLLRWIAPIIPPFLFGFLIKMRHDGMLMSLLRNYAPVVAILCLSLTVYLTLFYFTACGFRPRKVIHCLRNMIPAVICAFSSMSSAAAMPYTLAAVEKNTTHKFLGRSIVSMTTNIHLIGDCISIPILIYAILGSHGIAMPSMALYCIFAVQFVLAKFSVAAIPGGGIMVMLPIIERVFAFDEMMASLIFSLYILLDPLCTAANVLGNGAFAQLMDAIVPRRTGKHGV